MTMTDTDVSGRLPDVMPGHWDTPEGAQMARDYAAKVRTDLAMGEKSDLLLANLQYMQMRDSWDLGAYQTAAKERIRWLSARLAVAEAELAVLRSPGGDAELVAELVAALRHALKLLEPFDDPELSLGLGSNALAPIRAAIANAEAAGGAAADPGRIAGQGPAEADAAKLGSE